MPTLAVAIDASGAARGAGMFHTHARTVTKAATQVGVSTGQASKQITKMGGSLGGVAKLIGTLGIFYMFQRLARSAIGFAADQERTLAQLRIGLESTGGVSNQTMASLQGLSAEMQSLTVYSNEVVESAAGVMLSFTNIADDVFPRAMKATADIATRMGTDLQSSVIQVAKALNDPVANLGALSRAGIQFSKDQKTLIKRLWETGKQAEAQRLILGELENQYGGSAEAARNTLGGALAALKNEADDLLKSLVPEGGLTWALVELTSALEGVNKPSKDSIPLVLKLNQAFFALTSGTVKSTSELGRHMAIFEQWTKDNRASRAAMQEAEGARARLTAEEKQGTDALEKSRQKIEMEIEALENKTWALGLTKAESAAYYTVVRGGTQEQADMVRMLHEQIAAFERMKADEEKASDTAQAFEENTRRAREELERFVQTPMEQLQAEMDRVYELGVKKLISTELWENASIKIRAEMDELAKSLSGAADDAGSHWENTAKQIGDSMASTLTGIIVDADNVGEAFQNLAREIARMIVQQAISRAITAGISSIGAAHGLVFNQGAIVPFARGGVVNQPTTFPMSGGRTGLMGEAGAEAVMPLARGRDGKLGVKVDGEGGGTVQHFTFNIKSPDADSFRRSQGQILTDMRSGASRLKG